VGIVLVALAVASCRAGPVTKVVDGDTLDVNGQRVRILGIDTPERGRCGYREASTRLAELVGGVGGNVVVLGGGEGHDTHDRYGRELGYVQSGNLDVGEVLLREGLAKARYDSLDGYGRHDRQDLYRRIDAQTPDPCAG